MFYSNWKRVALHGLQLRYELLIFPGSKLIENLVFSRHQGNVLIANYDTDESNTNLKFNFLGE